MSYDTDRTTPYHQVSKAEGIPHRYFDSPDDVFGLSERASRPMAPRKIEGAVEGMDPIDELKIPKSWKKEINESNFGDMAKSVSFFPPDGHGVALALYDRGFPIANGEADRFRSILSQDPHVLSAAEIATLGASVLGNIGDQSAFKISHAETKEVNGKTVLAVDGDWKEGGKKFSGMYVPKDDAARQIQEVYYEGTEPFFSRYRPEAIRSMESIKWNDDHDHDGPLPASFPGADSAPNELK